MFEDSKKFKIGIIRVLTTKDKEVFLSHQNILEKYFPEFIYETKCIPDQNEGIHDEKTYDKAYNKIINIAKEWEREIDGLIISCAGDPAVDYLNELLSIPVVGAGLSTASMSLIYGKKVGVIGISKWRTLDIYSNVLGDKLVSYELPNGVKNTNDLQTEAGRIAVLESAAKLSNMGCDVIAFACTGFSTAKIDIKSEFFDKPIIDNVVAEGAVMKFKIIERYMKGH